jgi:O-antigen ligase
MNNVDRVIFNDIPRKAQNIASCDVQDRDGKTGFLFLAISVSLLNLLNYLNYTFLRFGAYLPEIRAGLTVLLGLILMFVNARWLLGYHVRLNFDFCAFAVYCLATTAYSTNPQETFIYSLWLLLALYIVLELVRRIEDPKSMATTLFIVVMPIAFLAASANIILGPSLVHGRVLGALGTHHVDSAIAMDVLLLVLAAMCLPNGRPWAPAWLKAILLLLAGWAVYQSIFGLTRSVWLCMLMSIIFFAYAAPIRLWQKLSLGAALVIVLVAFLAFSSRSLLSYIPREVQGRIKMTEQRYEKGEIDPRLRGIDWGFAKFLERPIGYGYANGQGTHNTYVTILFQAGIVGALLAGLVIIRSCCYVFLAGRRYILFFAVGGFPLLVHAFFEVQSYPGQANFYLLLVWSALTRSPAVRAAVLKKRTAHQG